MRKGGRRKGVREEETGERFARLKSKGQEQGPRALLASQQGAQLTICMGSAISRRQHRVSTAEDVNEAHDQAHAWQHLVGIAVVNLITEHCAPLLADEGGLHPHAVSHGVEQKHP